jgi:hypothetical protein
MGPLARKTPCSSPVTCLSRQHHALTEGPTRLAVNAGGEPSSAASRERLVHYYGLILFG